MKTWSFLRATAYYSIMLSPVRLSVCHTGGSYFYTKTVKVRIIKSSPYGSPIPLVFREQVSSRNSEGSPRTEALNEGGVGKLGDFPPLSRHITNRNVCTRFPLVPKSMTLSDPWPGFQGHGMQNWRFSAFKPPISPKPLKLGSCSFHRTVAPSL